MVQSVVRSNCRPDPVISLWKHTGVRSSGSDQSTIWAGPQPGLFSVLNNRSSIFLHIFGPSF